MFSFALLWISVRVFANGEKNYRQGSVIFCQTRLVSAVNLIQYQTWMTENVRPRNLNFCKISDETHFLWRKMSCRSPYITAKPPGRKEEKLWNTWTPYLSFSTVRQGHRKGRFFESCEIYPDAKWQRSGIIFSSKGIKILRFARQKNSPCSV